METRETMNGAPAQVWSGQPPAAPRASIPWMAISVVIAFVVLLALLATTVFAWQGAKGDLADSEDRLAQITDEYDASKEKVAALEEDVTDLEGRVNGANLTLSDARSCISGLQDSVNAVRRFFVPEDWETFFDRLSDVRGVCRRVMNSANTVF